jgi:hypothetical protein
MFKLIPPLFLAAALLSAAEPARGPLRVHPDNPRYFTDGSGRAVYLTGSHTWNNIIDMGSSDPPPKFDFDASLKWAEGYGHNFIRLWTWELTNWDTRGNDENKRHIVAPLAYARTGPGNALDGKPKFNLKKFNKEYFQRLKSRASEAGRRGFYVSIMLFEGWGLQFSPDAWKAHPFNPENNVNGVDGGGAKVHELANPEVTLIQEAYVRKVIDTVNSLNNVLYEISNENHPPSTEWQYRMINFIHKYEKTKRKQHPVGMTFQYKGGTNQALFDSPADWISPNPDGGYKEEPPAATGKKVILNDTDHLWGLGGNQDWVWKSFLRGMNPLFMDPYDGLILGGRFEEKYEPVRRSLGYTLEYARRVDLARMIPRPELASSGYCLADAGKEYLVYVPGGGAVSVDLAGVAGEVTVEWFEPAAGKKSSGEKAAGGARREFKPPFEGSALLYLRGVT